MTISQLSGCKGITENLNCQIILKVFSHKGLYLTFIKISL
nr:MAG TPA: hypothetical protein [Caudoviricetes sp.]